MKHYLRFVVLVFLINVFSSSPSVYGQSKKKLKAEILALKTRNEQLYDEKNEISEYAQNMKDMNIFLRSEIKRLENEVNQINEQYSALNHQFTELETQLANLTSQPQVEEAVQISSAEELISEQANGNARSLVGDCVELSSKLQLNQSYSLTYETLLPNSWGVQLYASSSLCQAERYAQIFSEANQEYTTYIRVKSVNQQQLYAVIYGAWQDKSHATSYRDTYRSKARTPQEKEVFIIRH